MTLLIASNILLWIGFIALIVINIALVRQIGVLYERVAPAGALMLNQTLKVGDAAPHLDVPALDGKTVHVGKGRADGKAQLLFFLSPDCPVCKSLLPVLKSSAAAEAGWLSVVLASDGPDQDHIGYTIRNGITQPYVVSELLGKSYGVGKLPYAVLIDEAGKIASLGIVNTREHLESLFEAKERKVASLQDYMKQQSA